MPRHTYYYPRGTFNSSDLIPIWQFRNGTVATPINVQLAHCQDTYDLSTYEWDVECTPEMLPGCPDSCANPVYPEGSFQSQDASVLIFPGEPPVGFTGQYCYQHPLTLTQLSTLYLALPLTQDKSGTSGCPRLRP